jgi:oxalate---CoA ligase
MAVVPQKQKAVTSHSRSNVSLLRRENEFLKILEQFGGIVYPGSKEFLDAHLVLLDTLSSAGESTSGLPGIKVDKRTIDNTFDSLENRGKVKVLKTAISTVTGAQRPARIIYLPTLDQSRLDAFLVELGKSYHGSRLSVTTPAATSVPPSDLKTKRPAQPLKRLQSERGVDKPKSSDKADQLFQSDDQTIHDALLAERTTLAQVYGFIPGKMMRARELHLATLDYFESCHDPPISALAAKRIVIFSQYLLNLPVGVYCSLVSTLVQSDELSQILSTEEGQGTLLKDLPQPLQTLLQIGRPRSRERFIELFETLQHLDLVAPLQPSDSENPLIRCESNGDHPSSFDPFAGDVSSTSFRVAPDYWLFHQEAALYLWVLSTASPPFWKTVPVFIRLDASNYWNELQLACTNKAFAQSVTQGSPSQNITPDSSFARSIVRETYWNEKYELSRHQRQYLKRFTSRRGDDTLLEDEGDPFIEKISWTISAPLSVVKDFLQKERTSRLRELDRGGSRTPGNEDDTEDAGKMAHEKELLGKKVADAKARKEREWEAILNAVHPGAVEGAAATRVSRVRKRYLQSGVSNDRSRWEGETRDAIRESRGAAKAVLPSAQRVTPVRPSQGLPSALVAVPPAGATATPSRPAGLPQPVANQPGKSIEQLISEQGPAREDTKRKKRKETRNSDGMDFLSD